MRPPFDPLRQPVRGAFLCLALALGAAACGGGATPAATPATTGPTSTATAAGTNAATLVVTPSPAPATAAIPTVPPTPAPTAIPVPTVPPTPTSPPAPAIGVAIPVGGQQLMTVLEAEQWPGTSSVKPRSGKAFFTVSIRIDAILLTSFDSADFRLRDAAGKTCGWRTGRTPHLYDLANMSPGNNYIGWITYEVPKTVIADLTLVYKPSFSDGAIFEVPVS